jgi:outer membrane protein OmpA-like peptidoglycan-associated protein
MIVRNTLVGLAVTLAACATTVPPQELTNAQMAYMKAKSGPAPQVVPDELHKAKTALDTAEQAYLKAPKALSTRDLAYIAERKAMLAEAKAQVEIARREKANADEQYTKSLTGLQKQTQRELEATKRDAESRLAEQKQAASEQIAAEQQARVEAERKAATALSDLAKIAQLREEDRGTVISLSGDILFVTGEASILPSAQLKLNQLAEALSQTNQRLIIEGHTDSRGSDTFNQDLSYRRATAVRDYLVGRGLPLERFGVNGYGKTRPIADNRSPEGRALNRRVEIVIEGRRTDKTLTAPGRVP